MVKALVVLCRPEVIYNAHIVTSLKMLIINDN
jgi:hypothetical protein